MPLPFCVSSAGAHLEASVPVVCSAGVGGVARHALECGKVATRVWVAKMDLHE